MSSLEFRLAKQDCQCRGCWKHLKKGEDMIITNNNYGKTVILCMDCVKEMNKLIKKKPDEN